MDVTARKFTGIGVRVEWHLLKKTFIIKFVMTVCCLSKCHSGQSKIFVLTDQFTT